MDSYFQPFKIIVSFFLFMSRSNKTRSKCTIIGCNLSKNLKLTLYKTQNGESNSVDHKFFFNFYEELPTCAKLWGQTFLYYIDGQLFGCLYCVTLRLHDIKKRTSVYLEYTMEVHLADSHLSGESPPSTFPLQFGQLFKFIFVIHFTKSKLIIRSVAVVKLPKKMHYSFLQEYKSVTNKSKNLQKIQV